MMKYVFVLLSPALLCGQAISNVKILNTLNGSLQSQCATTLNAPCATDTNAVTVQYDVSGVSPGYCSLAYGVVSGVYLWQSESTFSTYAYPDKCSVPIGGLADGTTYYLLPQVRLNPNDDAGMCNTSACGALEQVITVASRSVSHFPALPKPYPSQLLGPPDTSSNYVTVTIAATGPNGECAAQNTVSAPPGYSGTINAGDTLTTIFNAKFWYGTILEGAPGTLCIVKPTDTNNGMGYSFHTAAVDPLATGVSIDAADHRWFIVRTSGSNVPPFGFRVTPSWNLLELRSNTPANPGALGGNPYGNSGFIIQAVDDIGSHGYNHHIWFDSVKFSTDPTVVSPSNVYQAFMRLGNPEGGASPPYPDYVVIRGCYFVGPNSSPSSTNQLPAVTSGIMSAASNFVIRDSYFDNIWFSAYPGHANMPQAVYIVDAQQGGGCSAIMPNIIIDNTFFSYAGQGVYIESNTSNCPPLTTDVTISHSVFYNSPAIWNYIGQVCNSQWCPIIPVRDTIETKSSQRMLVSGVYVNGGFSGVGNQETFLAGLNGYTSDITFRSLYVSRAGSLFSFSGGGNNQGGSGGGGTPPGSWYGWTNRAMVTNSVAFNWGRPLWNIASATGAVSTALGATAQNVFFKNNTIVGPLNTSTAPSQGYAPWIVSNTYGGNGPMAGLLMRDNILTLGSIGALSASGFGSTYQSNDNVGARSHVPVAGDNVNGNTVPQNINIWLGHSYGVTDGGPHLSLQGISVVSGGAGYPNSGSVLFSGCSTSPTATYWASSGTIYQVTFDGFGSGCDPATMTAAVTGGSGATLKPWYGLTPRFDWGGNVVACAYHDGADMSNAQCAADHATMPAGDIYPAGSSTVARQVEAGLAGVSSNDFRCVATATSSCSAGANMNTMASELGIVSTISTLVSSTSSAISYIAPDAKPCSADVSPDGTTWTRLTDGGGLRQRSILFTGLTGGTVYRYRLMCYFDQSEAASTGWFSFPSEPSNLSTDGTFTTLARVTRNPLFWFDLALFKEATSVTFTMTDLEGSNYVNTCTTTPCMISGVPVGDYKVIRSYDGPLRSWKSEPEIVKLR